MSNPQTLLIIDDEKDVHYSFRRFLEKEPLKILSAESGTQGIKTARESSPDVIVMDIRMGQESGLDVLRELRRYNPKQIVILMTAYGTSQTAIEAMKLGAFDYILKPFDIPQLKELLTRALAAATESRSAPAPAPVARLSPEDIRQTIIGNAPAMQQVYKLIGQVAGTDATVLITGESGTGKELVARALHQNSPRNKHVFVPMNCAALPETLLESELFGHERGAFTGAMNQRVGKFELCDRGTLFLDEIGEMPLATQTKFLRVLQEGEFARLGNNEPMKTDVRILAATNKDLWRCVERKEFREDLYYRLNVFQIPLPPLRERLSDLPLLVTHLLNKYRSKHPHGPMRISQEALDCMSQYYWPGNVRELENCIQRALVLAGTNVSIEISHLPFELTQSKDVKVGRPAVGEDLHWLLERLFRLSESKENTKFLPWLEEQCTAYAMNKVNGDPAQAAKMLGISKTGLRTKPEKKA